MGHLIEAYIVAWYDFWYIKNRKFLSPPGFLHNKNSILSMKGIFSVSIKTMFFTGNFNFIKKLPLKQQFPYCECPRLEHEEGGGLRSYVLPPDA